jgi:hypothetical protein
MQRIDSAVFLITTLVILGVFHQFGITPDQMVLGALLLALKPNGNGGNGNGNGTTAKTQAPNDTHQ